MYRMLSKPDTLVSSEFQVSLNSPVILSNFSNEEIEGIDVLCNVIFLASFKLGVLMLLHVKEFMTKSTTLFKLGRFKVVVL